MISSFFEVGLPFYRKTEMQINVAINGDRSIKKQIFVIEKDYHNKH